MKQLAQSGSQPGYQPWIIKAAQRGVPDWVLGVILSAQTALILSPDEDDDDESALRAL